MSILKISLLFFAVLATSVAASGCPSPGGGFEDELRERTYTKPIAAARADDVPIYWLGESVEFDRGDLDVVEFSYPSGIEGVEVKGIGLSYFREGSKPGLIDLDVVREDEWPRVADRVYSVQTGFIQRTSVSVDGRPAELLTVRVLGDDIAGYYLVMPLEDAVVLATVSSQEINGVEANPFMTTAVFFRAMQNIQPFTEDLD